jgi:hypothetical protein
VRYLSVCCAERELAATLFVCHIHFLCRACVAFCAARVLRYGFIAMCVCGVWVLSDPCIFSACCAERQLAATLFVCLIALRL